MLPRVHAVTDARVLSHPAFLDRARHVASLGAAVAIHLRDRTATGRALADHAVALRAALEGSGTALVVNARPDIAAAVSADGVQLGRGDLGVADARRVMASGWIGRSVHDAGEARTAVAEGADYLVAGTTWESASHPGIAAQGTPLIRDVAFLGVPVIAIGGVTPERAGEARAAGAYGVASISAIWDAGDPARAVALLLAPWEGQ